MLSHLRYGGGRNPPPYRKWDSSGWTVSRVVIRHRIASGTAVGGQCPEFDELAKHVHAHVDVSGGELVRRLKDPSQGGGRGRERNARS